MRMSHIYMYQQSNFILIKKQVFNLKLKWMLTLLTGHSMPNEPMPPHWPSQILMKFHQLEVSMKFEDFENFSS